MLRLKICEDSQEVRIQGDDEFTDDEMQIVSVDQSAVAGNQYQLAQKTDNEVQDKTEASFSFAGEEKPQEKLGKKKERRNKHHRKKSSGAVQSRATSQSGLSSPAHSRSGSVALPELITCATTALVS